MATFFELPIGNDFPYFVVNSSGASVPASGYQIGTFTAGTTTPVTTYTDSTGSTPNSNPVLLGSTGLPQSGSNVVGIWVPQGTSVKVTFAKPTDTFPPSSAIWTKDQLQGINDPTNITSASEWVQGTAPTFISTTSFSVAGDQRTIYQVGRRLKTINSGGTIYSRITASSFGSAITTVTIVNDSGVLDSGLNAVSYGILSHTNPSIPLIDSIPIGSITPSTGTFTQVNISTAVGKIVPGATSISLRNNADNADNLLIADAGTATLRTAVGVGGTTPAGGGAGVQFPATQSASTDPNNLDDYEEGTWVPSLGGSTTYSVQSGFYTKVGRTVHFYGRIVINVNGTGTNITGLPFTSLGFNDYRSIVKIAMFGMTTATVEEQGVISNSTTTIVVQKKTAAATTWTNIAAGDYANSADIQFSGTYDVT